MYPRALLDYYWPFHQIGIRDVTDLPEHLKELMRMKNRWKLLLIEPFIERWVYLFLAISIPLGLLMFAVEMKPDTPITIMLWWTLWTAWFSCLAVILFLGWLYWVGTRELRRKSHE